MRGHNLPLRSPLKGATPQQVWPCHPGKLLAKFGYENKARSFMSVSKHKILPTIALICYIANTLINILIV